jgi:ferric-dicitrate binding protein FerR (iron transport regulator)
MKQSINDNANWIDVDQAWITLYTRLEKENLLPVKTDCSSSRKRKIPLQWMAVAAAFCVGLIISVFYFSQDKDHSQVFLQNKENSGTLVATLDDGSTVYLAPNASISCPAAFAPHQRKVKLNGNALFYVTKDEKRPFVVETNEKITIEVAGTIFAVQSSLDKPFELSVKQGKVNVHTGNNQTRISVEAGETVRLNTGELTKSGIANLQVFNRFTDKMCFKDEKLNNIIQAINTIYGFPAIIAEKSLNNRTLTVTFDNNSVENMAELICLALNLEQINKQDTLFIRPFLK